MTEEERKKIIDRINKEVSDKELLEEKKKELEELSHNEVVQAYLNMQKSISKTEDTILSYKRTYGNDKLETRINHTFKVAIHKKDCTHELWIYQGAYYEYTNFEGEADYTTNPDYRNAEFAYYRYKCIECGKVVKVKNNDEFELNHYVMKDNNQIHKSEYYQNMYYQLLYQGYTSEEAFQELSKEFKNNQEIEKKKNLKKGK